MVIASLVVLGLLSFGRLGVDLFPKIEFPYVSVTTTLPGASPDTIETEITDVIEEEVNSVSGIRQMRSVSAEGVSQVVLEFELSEDADVKAQDVRDRVASILSLIRTQRRYCRCLSQEMRRSENSRSLPMRSLKRGFSVFAA